MTMMKSSPQTSRQRYGVALSMLLLLTIGILYIRRQGAGPGPALDPAAATPDLAQESPEVGVLPTEAIVAVTETTEPTAIVEVATEIPTLAPTIPPVATVAPILPTVVRPTAMPATAAATTVPTAAPVTESINFYQDGPKLTEETVCTSVRWDVVGFSKVYVWMELGEDDRGAEKPLGGQETNICGIKPKDHAVFNLAAVRANGSEERRTVDVKNEGGEDDD